MGARGVVIVDGLILFLKYQQDDETAYLFSGGGHGPGETPAETTQCEVLEETGLTVEVGLLLVVHEYQPSKRVDTADDIRAIRCF